MDYEEKCALERAKEVLLDCTNEERKVVERIFPELAESEDEKTRKVIKKALENCLNIRPQLIEEPQYLKAITWLEEQKEQTPVKSEQDESHQSTFPMSYGKVLEKKMEDTCRRFGSNKSDALSLSEVFYAGVEAQKEIEQKPATPLANGVYYVTKDGGYVKTTNTTAVIEGNQVEKLGIAHDGHYFAIPLNWDIYGPTRLTNKDSYPEDEYCMNEVEALVEWDFVKHTRHIQELGTPINLQDGHYIPTLAVLLAMFANKDGINGALNSLGVEKINWCSYFWSCLRNGTVFAWYAGGGGGFFGNGYMYGAYVCVPVSLWEPLSEAS